jgi:UDPglucose--hexose-1-phosphate uridylyltransferase
MPSFRRHIITGDPVVFAPDRAERPNAFGDSESEVCPFCPGNEALTPPEIERTGDPWRARVFPNKYPAVDGHEVIVESPEHGATFDRISHAAEVVEAYVRRYRAHSQSTYVSLFSNEGRRAGASIDHLHSQVMPLPYLPPRIAREAAAFREAASCPLCRAIDRHRDQGLVIDETATAVRITPSAPSHAYEQWIVPLRHHHEMSTTTETERGHIARLLQLAAATTRRVAPAHNVLFMNFPHESAGHFYISIVPRRSAIAGFELATGTFIDIIDPAAAVRALR